MCSQDDSPRAYLQYWQCQQAKYVLLCLITYVTRYVIISLVYGAVYPILLVLYYPIGVDKYSNLATQLLPVIADSKAIIYMDFTQDVAPLAISLRQQGLESCGYHGEKMTANDKQKTLENWKAGDIQVSHYVPKSS